MSTLVSPPGADGGTRTRNLLFTKQLLCQLSYTGPSPNSRHQIVARLSADRQRSSVLRRVAYFTRVACSRHCSHDLDIRRKGTKDTMSTHKERIIQYYRAHPGGAEDGEIAQTSTSHPDDRWTRFATSSSGRESVIARPSPREDREYARHQPALRIVSSNAECLEYCNRTDALETADAGGRRMLVSVRRYQPSSPRPDASGGGPTIACLSIFAGAVRNLPGGTGLQFPASYCYSCSLCHALKRGIVCLGGVCAPAGDSGGALREVARGWHCKA